MDWWAATLVLTAIVAMVLGMAVNRVWAALLPVVACAAYIAVAGDSAFGGGETRTLLIVGAAFLTLFLLAGVWVRRMKPDTARRVSRMRSYW